MSDNNLPPTKQDLLNLENRILDGIKGFLKGGTKDQREWLRSADVRKLLGISPGTLQNMRINGTLPYSKVNGLILYNYSDMMKVLQDNKVDNGSTNTTKTYANVLEEEGK